MSDGVAEGDGEVYRCNIHNVECQTRGEIQQHIDQEHPGGAAKDSPIEYRVVRRGVEMTDGAMFYCPSCEVLLAPSDAYEHTYDHQDKGPNTGAVMDWFRKIPIAEPDRGEWADD